jgi:hypothetical protein
MNEIRYSKVFPRTKAALEKVPIEEVAKIAAMLVRNPASAGAKEGLAKEAGSDEKTTPSEATTRRRVDEENPLVGATAKAFELLEIAYYGKDGLTNRNSYEAGLAEFVEDKRIAEDFLKAVESLPGC